MTQVVLATANPEKAREIAQILGDRLTLRPRPADVPEVEETGATLLENARLKARALASATGLPAIADDTGLEVQALDGAPGVFSARFAGPKATYDQNIRALLEQLTLAAPPRSAKFRTVAVIAWPDGRELVAEGVVDGIIANEARGTRGFGYDPVFIPDGHDGRTFAEMAADEKHRISHRGEAFRALAEQLRVYQSGSGLGTGNESARSAG